ncbi:MAG: hypothetical protein LBN05_08970 [Oscillospiraceae bacterium]|jgi:hypothetical protein|nr:hypothetical protein [Oscillospiraceae bacterium]
MADQENTTPAPETPPLTFTSDYVSSLRAESKAYRQRAKAAEDSLSAVRKAFGLKSDEDIGDIAARLTARDAQALGKANDILVSAEIRSLQGYDVPLLEKVIDRTGIKVTDGKVEGVKEAAEAAAKAHPAVKQQARTPWVGGNPATDGADKTSHGVFNAWARDS